MIFRAPQASKTEFLLFVTSLVGSGSEILGRLFDAPDWRYLESSDTDPIFGESGKFLDQNSWLHTNASKTAISWLHTLTEKPEILLKNNNQISKDRGYLTAFNANYGTWNRKHLFLAAALKVRVRRGLFR